MSVLPPVGKRRRIDGGVQSTVTVNVCGDDAGDGGRALADWKQKMKELNGTVFSDKAFVATSGSIRGDAAPANPAPAANIVPRCGCKVPAGRSEVKKATPNKGRPYYHCANRRCTFFCWADRGGGGGRDMAAGLTWIRLPALEIVSDFGFRAKDLVQGGVGDCWFMSALAVVAERHDLIAKLFTSTPRNRSGFYSINLFLDGAWSAILLDDRLPATATPRRADLTFGSGLAFCRCGSAETGQQLWASLLEKAYAKAHGSYKAISGGEIAEALLDLTGAPTITVDFASRDFDMELLWQRLRAYGRAKYPMGCATAPDPMLKEVGLCGSHAYSILDVREVRAAGETVRLIRVRNPHGVGEWNGDFSDNSEKWSSIAAAGGSSLERTGVNDGTFWIDYTHFMMAFSVVDVALADKTFHSKSFDNAFPASNTGVSRNCAFSYKIEIKEPTTVFALVLQPTKRGARLGRADRKKSYKPGDISCVVVKLAKGNETELVGGGFSCAISGGGRGSFGAYLDDPSAQYTATFFVLGSNPTAAESKGKQPFKVRLVSTKKIGVTVCDGDGSLSKKATLNAIHAATITAGGWREARSLVFQDLPRAEAALMNRNTRRIIKVSPVFSLLIGEGFGTTVCYRVELLCACMRLCVCVCARVCVFLRRKLLLCVVNSRSAMLHALASSFLQVQR